MAEGEEEEVAGGQGPLGDELRVNLLLQRDRDGALFELMEQALGSVSKRSRAQRLKSLLLEMLSSRQARGPYTGNGTQELDAGDGEPAGKVGGRPTEGAQGVKQSERRVDSGQEAGGGSGGGIDLNALAVGSMDMSFDG